MLDRDQQRLRQRSGRNFLGSKKTMGFVSGLVRRTQEQMGTKCSVGFASSQEYRVAMEGVSNYRHAALHQVHCQ